MSSGSTTGHQKAIIWTNRQWLALMAIEQHREVLPLTAADIMLSRTSFHLMGVRYLFYTIVASGSAQLVITTNRLPNDKIFQAIHDYSVTMYFAVPTELWFLAKHYRKYDKQYLKSLRDLRVGGDSLTNEVYNKINRLYGFNKFRRTYGMSECGLVFIVPSSEQNIANHTDSIGKVGPGLEVKIIDTISGNSLPANQTGQICIRGPTLTPGYYGNPSATKQLFTTDGFLLSADLGYYDENEYFYFVDRLKDVIKFDDKNISPKELELQLMTHPLVDMAAVLGIDDQQYGQIPRAFVTLIATDTADNTDDTDGVMKLREQDIQQYVNERVNVYKQLRGGVKIIDKMPMTSLGKISKAKLREI
ncbi:uncharacterized protein LOC128954373 [Oppia nitens]|uniref:uncharacterized protein LOC128954373 n=1 Tax=Oppia nitens TaxID=1686743 RepID=UPI0023DC873B|nr:uncharacterized protein LOC128954373 [Oppia nitens]